MSILVAGGSVRAQFVNDHKVEEQRFLARALEELQVPGYHLALVERLLELCPDAENRERRAVRIVATALISGINRGSTGLPQSNLKKEVDLLLNTARRLDEDGRVFQGDSADIILDIFQGVIDGGVAQDLIGKGTSYKPLVVEDDVLYTHKMAAMERRVTHKIAALLNAPNIVDLNVARPHMAAVLDDMGFPISSAERAEKVDVLKTALPGRFGVISGGAGSGKTTIVLTILRILRRLEAQSGGVELSEMALAAPTGKAAKRLGESMVAQLEKIGGSDRALFEAALSDTGNLQPRTLHRLLEYSPYFNNFRRNKDNRLAAKLVVVDEASMVGLGMMQSLIEALPDDGRLLLVGDAGQLPSVQAGAVFHDLSDEESAPPSLKKRIFVLKGNYRVADQDDAQKIVKVAGAIRDGEAEIEGLMSDELVVNSEQISDAEGVFFRAYDADDSHMGHFLDEWWKQHYSGFLTREHSDFRSQTLFDHDDEGKFEEYAKVELKKLFDGTAAAQILCITRVGRRGSVSLNRMMSRRYQNANIEKQKSADRFEPGEPVIITRNDYDEGVFNGDQGIILYTRYPNERGSSERAKKRVVIKDGDDFRVVSFDRLRDKLEHAYALTVHKSQGSEYQNVALVLPEPVAIPNSEETTLHPLMTRQILYTGLTRAKRSVVIFGEEGVFDEGVKASAERYSGVSRRLKVESEVESVYA